MTTEQGGQNSFARRAAWLTMAYGTAFGLSFLAPLILVRMLSQTEFGVYKQAFQILASTCSILNLQVASTIYYFMPRAPEMKLQVTINVLTFYGAAGALVAALFILYPQCVLLVFKGGELVTYMPMLGGTILLWLVAANPDAIPLALGDGPTSSVFLGMSQLTKSALTVGAAPPLPSIRAIISAPAIPGF